MAPPRSSGARQVREGGNLGLIASRDWPAIAVPWLLVRRQVSGHTTVRHDACLTPQAARLCWSSTRQTGCPAGVCVVLADAPSCMRGMGAVPLFGCCIRLPCSLLLCCAPSTPPIAFLCAARRAARCWEPCWSTLVTGPRSVGAAASRAATAAVAVVGLGLANQQAGFSPLACGNAPAHQVSFARIGVVCPCSGGIHHHRVCGARLEHCAAADGCGVPLGRRGGAGVAWYGNGMAWHEARARARAWHGAPWHGMPQLCRPPPTNYAGDHPAQSRAAPPLTVPDISEARLRQPMRYA